MNGVAQTPREAPLAEMSNALDSLNTTITDLRTRLEPILTPEPPNPESAKEPDSTAIREKTQHIVGLTCRLAEIISRIDL